MPRFIKSAPTAGTSANASGWSQLGHRGEGGAPLPATPACGEQTARGSLGHLWAQL